MLAKKTSKNQITLPAAIVRRFPQVDYFEVTSDGERITLSPLRVSRADEVRERLADYGISVSDIEDAVRWARGKR